MPCRLSRSLRPRPSGECVLGVGRTVEQGHNGLSMGFGLMDMVGLIVMVPVVTAGEDDVFSPGFCGYGVAGARRELKWG